MVVDDPKVLLGLGETFYSTSHEQMKRYNVYTTYLSKVVLRHCNDEWMEQIQSKLRFDEWRLE